MNTTTKHRDWKAQGPFVIQGGRREAWQLQICVVRSTVDPRPTPDALADSKEEAEEIARLIAAAPDLLEACHEAIDALKWYGEEKAVAAGAIKNIQAAIAKAEGTEVAK